MSVTYACAYHQEDNFLKVVIAIVSLKGSLTSLEAGDAIRAGVRKADPNAQIIVRPVSDGGEGTVEALTLGMGGTLQIHTGECFNAVPSGTPLFLVKNTRAVSPLPEATGMQAPRSAADSIR